MIKMMINNNFINRKDSFFYLFLSFLIWLFSSCTKEYIYGDPNCESTTHTNVDGENNQSEKVTITFTAMVYQNQSESSSRASDDTTIPLPKDCYAHIYVYEAGDYPGDDDWIYNVVYRAPVDGSLAPTNVVLELPPGLYNFYATSAFNFDSNQGPQVSEYTGIATSLSNGVDYLWWKDENCYVSKNNEVVPIVFDRCCAKLTFEMTAEEGHTLNSISHFDITVGDPSECFFSLRSGNIYPTDELSDSKQICTIEGNTASTIILPLETWKNLTATVAATVDNTFKWYTFSIPHWFSDNYRAGYEYIYELEFD